jgi:RecA-family ATPase
MMLRDREFPAEGQLQFITPEMQDETPPDLSLPHWHRHLAPFVEQAKLIIVDNISSLCRTGNENDADSWQVVQQWAIRQKSSGKSVLFIHHAGKGGNQRGTSKREDVMDSVISLKRPDDYTASQGARFEVHYEKSRGFSGEAAKPFVVQLEESEGQYRWQSNSLEETVYQQVARLLKEGIEQKDSAEELGINKSTVSRHAKRARQEGGI